MKSPAGHTHARIGRLLLAAAVVLLAACGAKEDVIEPSPLPSIDSAGKVRVERAWSADAGDGSRSVGLRLVPAVTAQAVYAIDDTGLLVARDRHNGRKLWQVKSGFAFSAGPVAGYGQLFAGTREGELLAFSADNGALLWKAQLGGEVLAPPAIDSDAVLVKTTDGRVTLFDRSSGNQRWAYDAGTPTLSLRAASQPVLLDDAVIAGLPGGLLVAVDRKGGQEIWQRRIAEPTGKSELDRLVDVAGDFLIAGERLFAASFQGKVIAMDMRSGQFLWQQPFSTHQPLAEAGDKLIGVDADGRIVAWRQADGVALWRQEALLGRGLTGCAVLGAYLIVGDFDGYLHVLRAEDGVIVGRRNLHSDAIAVPPTIDEQMAFVLARDGKLAALGIK